MEGAGGLWVTSGAPHPSRIINTVWSPSTILFHNPDSVSENCEALAAAVVMAPVGQKKVEQECALHTLSFVCLFDLTFLFMLHDLNFKERSELEAVFAHLVDMGVLELSASREASATILCV